MMIKPQMIAIILAAIVVAGCTRTSNPLAVNTRPPQPLPSVPAGNVESSQLDPVSGDLQNPSTLTASTGVQPQTTGTPTAPTIGGQTTEVPPDQTANLAGGTINQGTEPLARESLLGAWDVASDNSECRIMLAFTKWSGGYRAGSSACQSDEIGSVIAWDVKGQQVILVDGGGNTVARLYSSGNERYDGTLNSGKAISFTR